MRGRRRMDEVRKSLPGASYSLMRRAKKSLIPQGATPPPGARPSLSRSSTGASDPLSGDISLEMDMQDVSLGGEAEEILQDIPLESPGRHGRLASGPVSPSPPRHGRLPVLDFGQDDADGDISSALSPPRPSKALPTTPPSPGMRSLTSSPRRSRSPSTSPRNAGMHLPPESLEAGPSSSTLSLSRSVHTPLSGSSRSIHTSPGSPRLPEQSELGFHSRRPSIPTSMPTRLNGGIDDSAENRGDDEMDSAGFESIPISTTPPKSPTVPLPSSPRLHLDASKRDSKRRSWNGFGVAKSDKDSKRSSWLNGAPVASALDTSTKSAPMTRAGSSKDASIPEASENLQEGEPENGEVPVAKPRLHAPPAHPHPFPLPSVPSPTVGSSKRLSVTQLPADPGPSAPAGGIGAKGQSAFEKIVNHTRPSHLPPKPKDEDDTHYHQWEQMMAQAREHEKERRKLQDQRRLEKEKKLAAATPQWDALLNDPGFSAGRVKGDKALREMWFDGVPGYLRGKAWGLAIGNPLAMSKDAYKAYLSRARKALDSGRFPPAILEQMEADMDRTLPQLKLFGRRSPMRVDLQEFICAWVVYRSDDGLGYASYVSHIAAMLLLPSPPAQAFLQLCNLLARPCLHAFVTETKDEIDAFYRVFENLQADMFPKIYANCKNLGLQLPESYFRSILLEQVPFEACCRLWDQIVLDGDGYIFRSALAIFGFLEPRLHYPDKQEILSVLEGRNRATLAITEREKERAKLKGEAFDEELDGKLSVFGLNEDALFDWLASDGWRESRYERLVVREMPD